MVWSGVSDSRYPLAYFHEDSLGMKPPLDAEGYSQGSLGLRQVRFRSTQEDLMRWELYWWLPLSRLRGERYILVVEIDGPQGRAVAKTLAYRLIKPQEASPQPYAFGQINYDLRPGFYRATLRLWDREERICYRAHTATELLAYRRNVQESSDVELAVLSDTTYVAPQFRKGDYRRIVAMPGETVDQFQPFFVYYEIYNLTLSRDSCHYLSLEHQISSTDPQGLT